MTISALPTLTNLRAELRNDAFGVGTSSPRLSWTVTGSAEGWTQSSYEASFTDAAGTRFSGRIEGSDSVLVDWPFDPLAPRSLGKAQVRAWSKSGEPTAWSEPLDIEIGLLTEADWTAVPITRKFPGESVERPVRFRRGFSVRPGLRQARLYASALGIYTAEINGQRVGDELLAPGWTSYAHRIRYQTFDLSSQLTEGHNVVGLTVAEGWYRGRIGFRGGQRNIYGSSTGAIAQIELTYDDGTVERVATDSSWRAAPGPILMASLYDGETIDARLRDGWGEASFDHSGWVSARELPSVAARLEAPVGPPVRRIETLQPVSITMSPTGKTLVDFGQNMSGWVRIRAAGSAGHTLTVRHAEVLEHGELGTRPLRYAAATDTYILSGTGVEEFEPSFTIHGFRYAEIDNWPGDLTPYDLEAVVCHSDMVPTGTFHSSHAGLNRLEENVRWSLKGNFVDLPTDCPQRDERLGWTGDIQVFAPTASFLYDCSGFLASWLADVAAEQIEYGTVPHYVPYIQLIFPAAPAAAWGDAAVIVPWVLYEQFGDLGLLRVQYPSMCAWVEQIASIAGESHIWNEGLQFGDWLDPTAPPESPFDARTDTAIVATAYHAHTARLVARTAALLGYHAEAERYRVLAADIAAAFAAEFATPSGRMASDAQTAYALALQFDLLPTVAQRQRAASRLRELVEKSGYRIGTGFVGTPLVCDALLDAGYVDDAYLLLLQRECPSWLYPVSMGATTIWERWDSMLPDGSINPGEMTSFNHYALGAVADFIYRRVAGLAPAAAGWKKISVSPRPGGGLDHASASHRTPYGTASITWSRPGSRLVVDLEVPPSTTAMVELPGQAPVNVGPGSHHFECDYRAAADDPTSPPEQFDFEAMMPPPTDPTPPIISPEEDDE
jgi:alpha-L-rhamnosidase